MINEQDEGRSKSEENTNCDELSINVNSPSDFYPKDFTALTTRETDSNLKNESPNDNDVLRGPQNVLNPIVINSDLKEIKDIVHEIANAVFCNPGNGSDQSANRSSNTLGMRVKDSLILKIQQTQKKEIPFNEIKASLACRLIVDDDLQIRFLPRIESLPLSSDGENLSTKQKKSVSLAEEVKVFNQVENEFLTEKGIDFLNELMDTRNEGIMDNQGTPKNDDTIYDLTSQKSSFSPVESERCFFNELDGVGSTEGSALWNQDQKIQMPELVGQYLDESKSSASSKDTEKFDNSGKNPVILSNIDLTLDENVSTEISDSSVYDRVLGVRNFPIAQYPNESKMIVSSTDTPGSRNTPNVNETLIFKNEITKKDETIDDSEDMTKNHLKDRVESVRTELIDHEKGLTSDQSKITNQVRDESALYAKDQTQQEHPTKPSQNPLISNGNIEAKFVEQSSNQSAGECQLSKRYEMSDNACEDNLNAGLHGNSNAIDGLKTEEGVWEESSEKNIKRIKTLNNTNESVINNEDQLQEDPQSTQSFKNSKQQSSTTIAFIEADIASAKLDTGQAALENDNEVERITEKGVPSSNFSGKKSRNDENKFTSEARFDFQRSPDVDEKINDSELSEEKESPESLGKSERVDKDGLPADETVKLFKNYNDVDSYQLFEETFFGANIESENVFELPASSLVRERQSRNINLRDIPVIGKTNSDETGNKTQTNHEEEIMDKTNFDDSHSINSYAVDKDQNLERKISSPDKLPNSSSEGVGVDDEAIAVKEKERCKTSEIYDQHLPGFPRLSLQESFGINLKDAAGILLTCKESETDKVERKYSEALSKIESQQLGELRKSDEKLKRESTFDEKTSSPRSSSSPKRTSSKVSLNANLSEKSSRTDGGPDQPSTNDPCSEETSSKASRKANKSPGKLSRTDMSEIIILGSNNLGLAAETLLLSPENRNVPNQSEINHVTIESQSSNSFLNFEASKHPNKSEDASTASVSSNIEQMQHALEPPVSTKKRNGFMEGLTRSLQSRRNRSKRSNEKSKTKLEGRSESQIDVNEEVGSEFSTALKNENYIDLPSSQLLDTKSSRSSFDPLQIQDSRNISKSVSKREMDKTTMQKAGPVFIENLDFAVVAYLQTQSKEKNEINEKEHSDPMAIKNETIEEQSNDLKGQNKKKHSLLSSIKSISKSSEGQQRSVASNEDPGNADIINKSLDSLTINESGALASKIKIDREESVNMTKESVLIPVIRSMKSLQDNRKRSKNRRRTGHKLFDGEDTSFVTENLVRMSHQASTQSGFSQRQNEEKTDDVGVDNKSDSSEESITESSLQALLTDEEGQTVRIPNWRKNSEKKENPEGSRKRFMNSLSRIFSNSSGKTNVVINSLKATSNEPANPEDHFEITKILLSSSDDSGTQENDCKNTKQKPGMTEDNGEKIVAVKSLDSIHDSDNRNTNRESIGKRSLRTLESNRATNTSNEHFLLPNQSGASTYSASMAVNRTSSKSELAKRNSLDDVQEIRRPAEKIYVAKGTIVSYTSVVESAKYIPEELDDQSNESNQSENRLKISPGKGFSTIRKLFSRASIRNRPDRADVGDRSIDHTDHEAKKESKKSGKSNIVKHRKDEEHSMDHLDEKSERESITSEKVSSQKSMNDDEDVHDYKYDTNYRAHGSKHVGKESDKVNISENKVNPNRGGLKSIEIVGHVLSISQTDLDNAICADREQKLSQRSNDSKKSDILSIAKSYFKRHTEIERIEINGAKLRANEKKHDEGSVTLPIQGLKKTLREEGIAKTESALSRSLKRLFKKRNSAADSAASNSYVGTPGASNSYVENPADDLSQLKMQTPSHPSINGITDVMIETESRESRESKIQDDLQFTVYNVYSEAKFPTPCEKSSQKLEKKNALEHMDNLDTRKSKSTLSLLTSMTKKPAETLSNVGSQYDKRSSIRYKSTNEDTDTESSTALTTSQTHIAISFLTQMNPESETWVNQNENVARNRPRSKIVATDFRLNPSFASRRSTIVMMATPIPPREPQAEVSNNSHHTRNESSNSPTAFYYLLGPSLDEALVDVRVVFQNLIDKITGRGR